MLFLAIWLDLVGGSDCFSAGETLHQADYGQYLSSELHSTEEEQQGGKCLRGWWNQELQLSVPCNHDNPVKGIHPGTITLLTDTWINPLSPNSDQHQFSPNNIHTLSREMVMRINQMTTKEKMRRSFIKLSQLIFKEMYEYQCGEFVCGYWGLKG